MKKEERRKKKEERKKKKEKRKKKKEARRQNNGLAYCDKLGACPFSTKRTLFLRTLGGKCGRFHKNRNPLATNMKMMILEPTIIFDNKARGHTPSYLIQNYRSGFLKYKTSFFIFFDTIRFWRNNFS